MTLSDLVSLVKTNIWYVKYHLAARSWAKSAGELETLDKAWVTEHYAGFFLTLWGV